MRTCPGIRYFVTVTAAALLAGMACAQQAENPADSVYTMKGEYEIQRQGDGDHLVLRRLDNRGNVWESIAVTRVSEKNGELVYVDGSGKKYTKLTDGRLEEKVLLQRGPAASPSGTKAEAGSSSTFRLMTTAPVIPRGMNGSVPAAGNLMLPNGESALRSENGLVFLTTGVDPKGIRHEVVVQQVAEKWYVRTSVSNDLNEALVFRLEEDGSVSGFNQLPVGVPQVRRINTRNEGTLTSAPANPPLTKETRAAEPKRAEAKPEPGSGVRRVEYEGSSGLLVSDGGSARSSLYLDGQPGVIAMLEPVEGRPGVFTLAGRSDVAVIVDGRGKLIATDSAGLPVHLQVRGDTRDNLAAGSGAIRVEYQGRKGTIFKSSEEKGQRFYLQLDSEPDPVVLESVRGKSNLFTPVGRDDLLVVVSPEGRLSVTDLEGRPAILRQPKPEPPPKAEANKVSAPAEPVSLYRGPMSGTLECDGSPIPQHGEHVFANLPPGRLELTYDKSTWETEIRPNGPTQRLIIRNKRPGNQKKCTVRWTVVP